MKNKTFYSKLVFLKKKIFKKQIIPTYYASNIDNFFNNFHNILYSTKDLFIDKLIRSKDLFRDFLIKSKDVSRDNVIRGKDISKDFLIINKDLFRDFLIKSKDVSRDNVIRGKDIYRDKIINLTNYTYQNIVEIIKSIQLYKWNIDENSDKKAVSYIDNIITNSENVRSRIKKYYDLESNVVHPPVNTNKFSFKEDKKYWLSVNRLVTEKRIEMQIDAFNKMPDKKLIIVGSCDNNFKTYSENLIRRSNKNILFLEKINEEDLLKLYSECTGFITTAKDEDFGMSAVEAMASGKPVIAPNEGGYKESVIDKENGILIDNIDSNKIIKAVIDIESNLKDNNEFYRDKCIKRALDFDVESFKNKIIKIIELNNYNIKNKKIIFIVGIPRSGTTWLWNLLSDHRDIHCLTKKDFEKDNNNSNKKILEETNMLFEYSLNTIVKTISKKEKDIVVEKTPLHIQKIKYILKNFPNSKIIHVYRNPLSVYASYKFTENSDWYFKNIDVFSWVKLYKKIFKHIKENYNNKNILNIKYENLLENDFNTLEKIYDFIELDKYNIGNLYEKYSYKNSFPIVSQKRNVNSLKEKLTQDEIRFIQKKLNKEIDFLSKL